VQHADLYQILQCTPSSTGEQIRSSYRKLAKRYHPDLSPNDASVAEHFQAVTAAYDVLSDPQKRTLYDQLGVAAIEAGFDPARLENVGPGAEVRSRIVLPFVEAVNGTERSIMVTRRRGPSGPVQVRIPPGVERGQVLRIPGAGEPGRPPGPLMIDVEVAPHPLFRRKGRDVLLDLPLSVSEWILGTQLRVPTPSGRIVLDVPARMEMGKKIRVAGHGVAASRNHAAGDLFVSVRVEIPDAWKEHPEARELLLKLEELYPQPVRDGLFHLSGLAGTGSQDLEPPPESELEAEDESDPPTLS
jgi:DnaJ-class molecular chaperone